jgi:hypothetical protein
MLPLSVFRSPLSGFRFPFSVFRLFVFRFPFSVFRFPFSGFLFSVFRFPVFRFSGFSAGPPKSPKAAGCVTADTPTTINPMANLTLGGLPAPLSERLERSPGTAPVDADLG